ncbi:MAG: hypothetical protein QGG76_02620 [Candidatus Thalassarchaeaceae archaeon]|nr:hypothetical protein [Euryarchaeota archaeon]MDP6220461.1 hypothetical protein [Candidatus Thalassarchaeaceae archaeon]
MEETQSSWWVDPMVWLGLLQGVAIWVAMAVEIGLSVAWISIACGGIIGFFLLLVAFGYQDRRFARATIGGILLNAILAGVSAYYAF